MNRQEDQRTPFIEQSVEKEPNLTTINKAKEYADEEDICERNEVAYYIERSKLRKDSICITKGRLEKELREIFISNADGETVSKAPSNIKGKSVGNKIANNNKKPIYLTKERLINQLKAPFDVNADEEKSRKEHGNKKGKSVRFGPPSTKRFQNEDPRKLKCNII